MSNILHPLPCSPFILPFIKVAYANIVSSLTPLISHLKENDILLAALLYDFKDTISSLVKALKSSSIILIIRALYFLSYCVLFINKKITLNEWWANLRVSHSQVMFLCLYERPQYPYARFRQKQNTQQIIDGLTKLTNHNYNCINQGIRLAEIVNQLKQSGNQTENQ